MTEDSAIDDRKRALELCPELNWIVSELEIYEALLRTWQKRINLVSGATLASVWTRHFADSAQIGAAFPGVFRWVDLGSGAGFPGLVTALLLRGRDDALVHLVESDQRKAAFLRAVSRETGAPVIVHVGRIEQELPSLMDKVDGISARALAPLPQLVAWSREFLCKGAVGVFLKGEEWRNELTALAPEGSFHTRSVVSRTNPAARLIAVAREFPADGQFAGEVRGE